jgi:hypothetical protein
MSTPTQGRWRGKSGTGGEGESQQNVSDSKKEPQSARHGAFAISPSTTDPHRLMSTVSEASGGATSIVSSVDKSEQSFEKPKDDETTVTTSNNHQRRSNNSSNNDFRATDLAVAIAITEDDNDEEIGKKVLLHAEPHEPKPKPSMFNDRRIRLVAAAGVCIIVAVVLAIVFTVGTNGNGPTEAPTFTPFTGKEIAYFGFFTSEIPSSGSVDFYSREGPEYLAAEWIVNDDPLQLTMDSPWLSQRYALAKLYFGSTESGERPWSRCNPVFLGFEGNECPTNRYWLSGESECNWEGVTCVDGEVRSLYLGKSLAFVTKNETFEKFLLKCCLCPLNAIATFQRTCQ